MKDLLGGEPYQPPVKRYPDAPGWRANAPSTSRAAAEAFVGRAEKIRRDVLALLEPHPSGLTADEITERLHLTRPQAQPRISELKRQGKIEPTGERRPNASGCSATVWRLAGAGWTER